jgi:hypothetical protein
MAAGLAAAGAGPLPAGMLMHSINYGYVIRSDCAQDEVTMPTGRRCLSFLSSLLL